MDHLLDCPSGDHRITTTVATALSATNHAALDTPRYLKYQIVITPPSRIHVLPHGQDSPSPLAEIVVHPANKNVAPGKVLDYRPTE